MVTLSRQCCRVPSSDYHTKLYDCSYILNIPRRKKSPEGPEVLDPTPAPTKLGRLRLLHLKKVNYYRYALCKSFDHIYLYQFLLSHVWHKTRLSFFACLKDAAGAALLRLSAPTLKYLLLSRS